jgi:hypothetical protein
MQVGLYLQLCTSIGWTFCTFGRTRAAAADCDSWIHK